MDDVEKYLAWRKTKSVCGELPAWVISILRSFVEWQTTQQRVKSAVVGDGIECPICGEVNYCIHRDD
jgi:hypothetical protein